MKQYAIYEGNMERLTKKMVRIQNKCKKYGCDFTFREVGEEFREKTLESGRKINVRFVLVEAEGTAIMNGWRYVASLERQNNGQNLIVSACDIKVPKRYYDAPIICEHCKSDRYRKSAYIVYNEQTGEFKEVGTNCLCDFTHGLSAEGVAGYTAMFEDLIKGESPMGGGSWGTKYYHVEEMLRYAAETIRLYGYEKHDPESGHIGTKIRFFDLYNAHIHNPDHFGLGREGQRAYWKMLDEIERTGFDPNSEASKDMTEKAMKWIEEQEESNQYMHNLKTICSLDYVDASKFGFLVSLFPTWNRALEIEARRKLAEAKAREEAKNSDYIGSVGDRIEVEVEDFKAVTGWETQFGYTTIYKIVDPNGNVYTWKTSGMIPENAKKIKGTVKNHTEYRGVKQTELTRCKVA